MDAAALPSFVVMARESAHLMTNVKRALCATDKPTCVGQVSFHYDLIVDQL